MNAEAQVLRSIKSIVRAIKRPLDKLDRALTTAIFEADPSLDIGFTEREQVLSDEALRLMEELVRSLEQRKTR